MNRRLSDFAERARQRAAEGQNYAEAKGNATTAQPSDQPANPRTEASHARIASNIARDWWVVTRGDERLEIFFHPPQTLAEVRHAYPNAEVAPR